MATPSSSTALSSSATPSSSTSSSSSTASSIGKQSWPELVGKDRHYAVSVINRENPSLTVAIARDTVNGDNKKWAETVVVYIDKKNIVTSIPKTTKAMD